ncbi:patched domain-containing protein 3-like [Branchiostoma floridae x Branchiostoma belcheri]
MIAKWIDAAAGRVYYRWGKTVAKWPAPFILLPLVASGLLGYFGLIGLVLDDEFSFVPDNGKTLPAMQGLEDVSFFPSGDAMAEMIIQAKDGGDTLFGDGVVEEVLRLHRELTTASTASGDTFTALCFRDPATTECVLSGILQLMITAGSGPALRAMNLTYPYHNPNRVNNILGMYLGRDLGGVEVSQDGITILSSKALHLAYDVQANLSQWTVTFRQVCSEFESEKITVDYIILGWHHEETGTLPARVSPYVAAAMGLLILLSVASCMMVDWVLTKPWLAVTGVLSAALSIVSSMGVLPLAGVSFSSLNAAIPFLLLGIGVDDMFVMIAAWRKCDVRLPVEERMGRAMSDAGVSITITSLTDCLAFTSGITSVFPAVRIFCTYAAVGVAFDFLYQITFFAAFMSLTGRRERANRHCLTCRPVLPQSRARHKSATYRLCCAAGVSRQEGAFDNPSSKEFNQDPVLNRLLYTNFVPFILKPSSKVVIFLLYAAYMGVAIWGWLQIHIGLQHQRSVADDSYVGGYFDALDTHFQKYGRKVDIFTTEPQEYWKTEVQQAVLDKLKAFDQSQYFHNTSETAEVWLRDYLRFLNRTGNSRAATEKTSFLQILISQFLPTVGQQYYRSLNFTGKVDIFTTEPQEYWKTEVLQIVLDKLKAFDQSQYFHDTLETVEVWLRDFLRILNRAGNSRAATDKTSFLQILISLFLSTVGQQYCRSVNFTENYTGISASRFFVIPKDVPTTTSVRGAAMMAEARRIAEGEPFIMRAFSIDFFLSDQLALIPPSALQTAGIALAIMFAVCFLLIPHCGAAFLTTFALVSIIAGLVGYMTLWGINLDLISVIAIVMCTGFSVDFFAHITHAYVTSKAATSEEKLTDAVRAVGMPMLQSSLSTILGMLVLAFFPAYIFQALFKTVFLVMVLGVAHGLVILPILLTTLTGLCGQGNVKEQTTVKKNIKTLAMPNGGIPRPFYQRPHSTSSSMLRRAPKLYVMKPDSSLPNLRHRVWQDNPYFTPEMREWIKWAGRQKSGVDNPNMEPDNPDNP